MQLFKNEAEFQRWVVKLLRETGGHVEDFSYASPPHVPDLSVGLSNMSYWLECKFDTISRHDKVFRLSKVTRGQLEWLTRRQHATNQPCGLLALLYYKDFSDQYICYIPGHFYLDRIWGKKAPMPEILCRMEIRTAHVHMGADLLKHILVAHYHTA